MKSLILFYIIFTSYTVTVKAQESYIGFNYGFGLTKLVHNDTSDVFKLKQPFTINGQLGINYTFIFKSDVVIASKPSYAIYSFKLYNKENNPSLTYVYRFHYRNNPILVGYRVKVKNNNSLSLLGGLYYGELVAATKEDRRFWDYLFDGPRGRYSVYKENYPKDIYGFMLEIEFAQQISKKGYMVYRFNYHQHITPVFGEFYDGEIGINLSNIYGLIGMRLFLSKDDNIEFPIER